MKKANGFSLVEVMIVVGLLSGLAILFNSIVKNMHQGQATAETKMEELELRRIITTTLSDKAACINTFSGISIGGGVNAIKNNAGTILYQAGNIYGNNSLKIESMITKDLGQIYSDGTRKINLIINFKKMKNIVKQTVHSANIDLRVKASSASASITSCFADADEVVKAACESAGGTWTGSSCSFDLLYVKKSGDTMTGNLTAPTFLGNIAGATGTLTSKMTSAFFCTGTNCKAINDLALSNQTCTNGNVQKGVKADGTPNCVPLQCGANLYFAGLDGSGNPICRPYPTNTCPTNQYVSSVNANGTVNCSLLPNNAIASCPSGQVLQSISAGVPTCVNKGAGASCSPGQVVVAVKSDGSVECNSLVTNNSIIGGSCPSGQVMSGIKSTGEPICTTPIPRYDIIYFLITAKGSASDGWSSWMEAKCPAGFQSIGCGMWQSAGTWGNTGDVSSIVIPQYSSCLGTGYAGNISADFVLYASCMKLVFF
jgi:predicted hydrocarbon binding protein